MHWSVRAAASRVTAALAFFATIAALSACGGGGGGSDSSGGGTTTGGGGTPTSPVTPPVVSAPTATQVTLQSEAGDSIGQGRNYAYTLANAKIELTVTSGLISITVTGDEDWRGDFKLPGAGTLQAAAYEGALYYPTAGNEQAALRWYGGGRGCATATGSFWIDQVELTAEGFVRSLILRFERRCNGAAAALRGELRWLATDTTAPPAVAETAPATLWRPAAGATPAAGNYVHIESDAGDIVGLGRTRTYTRANARIVGIANSNFVEVQVRGEQSWYGLLWGRSTASNDRLQRGYYPDLTRYPFANPTRGGLAWVGEGRGCADVRGWAAIDRLEYDAQGQTVVAVEYRFEQRCVGSTAALRGAVRWTRADADGPATPSADSAPGSWRPPAGSTPSSGTYAYLSGEPGDSISAGSDYQFTPTDAVVEMRESNGQLMMTVSAQDRWFVYLRATPSTGVPMQPGVYANLPAWTNIGENQPHFSLYGRGAGCGDSRSWLAVDDVVYADGRLVSVDFRFEQRCIGAYTGPAIGAVRGEVHWRANDQRPLPGPAASVPANFWRPAAGATPAAAGVNYVHVQSMRSDTVGAGLTTTYTQATAALNVAATDNLLHVEVTGDDLWSMDFKGIDGRSRLEPGYYADLQRPPVRNPARGGMDAVGNARGCNTVRAGFIIDNISYTPEGALSGLQLRFEQHCEGSTPGALWSEVRWAPGDSTAPAGPTAVPAGLWQPAAGAVPASGNYLHFVSQGDFIGSGQTRTMTPADGPFSLLQNTLGATATLKLDVGTYFPWLAEFKVMSSLTRLQPGYYGAITGHRFQNPAKGGLSFSGDGKGCNVIDGWFVIDSVTYVGNSITALTARFEQACDGMGVLHAALNWRAP